MTQRLIGTGGPAGVASAVLATVAVGGGPEPLPSGWEELPDELHGAELDEDQDPLTTAAAGLMGHGQLRNTR